MADQTAWRRAYCGSALVAFVTLKPRLGSQKSLDARKVLRLYQIFAVEGCRRLDEGNRLRAIINEEEYNLYSSTFDRGGQIDLPRLRAESPITYLHGRHRLAAAEVFLHSDDHWWAVDFYREQGRWIVSHHIIFN